MFGQTTNQMLNAPKGAFYLWHSEDKSYPTKLAQHLERIDLKIISPDEMYNRPWKGTTKQVIVDHYALLILQFRYKLRDEIVAHNLETTSS
jgi:hypothetical protein